MALDLEKMKREFQDVLDNITDAELDEWIRKIQKEKRQRGATKWKDLSQEQRDLTILAASAAVFGIIVGFAIGFILV